MVTFALTNGKASLKSRSFDREALEIFYPFRGQKLSASMRLPGGHLKQKIRVDRLLIIVSMKDGGS